MKATWQINLGRVRSKLNESVKQKVERVSNKLYLDIFNNTPVLTGQLQASWNITHTFPDFSTIDIGGSEQSPMVNIPKKISNLPDSPIVYICNGKPYAYMIEYGYSKKAPNGMVRLAISKLR